MRHKNTKNGNAQKKRAKGGHEHIRHLAEPMKYDSIRSSSQRFTKAWGIIFIALVVACVIDQAIKDDSPWREQVNLEHPFSQVSFAAAFNELAITDMRTLLPEDFEKEVMSLESFTDVQVSEGAGVIGFYSEKEASAVFKECALRLTERGWTKVESGHETFASFVRTAGTYTWLYLSCSSVSGGTSVVVQVG